jgi:hypothetical protein
MLQRAALLTHVAGARARGRTAIGERRGDRFGLYVAE